MNTELTTAAKNDVENDFFKLINNPVFGKNIENVWKHRNIKLVTTDKRRIYLVSQQNYHKTKCFSENLLAIEMNETEVKLNKKVYLTLSILNITKIAMYEDWYDYAKSKYGHKAKLCYTDNESLIFYAQSREIYAGLAGNVLFWNKKIHLMKFVTKELKQ